MNISTAIQHLQSKQWEKSKMARAGWNGKNMFVTLHNGEEINSAPFLVLTLPNGTQQAGWNASTPDLLSEDWLIL